MDERELLTRLGVALTAGLLMGVERGWREREEPEGHRVAGIRTFGLLGLSGGVWALLAEPLGAIALAVALAVFGSAILFPRLRMAQSTGDYGATTIVAALLAFSLGALAGRGQLLAASAGAVVATMLLGLKPVLHRWLTRLTYEELLSALKLAFMSAVLLPVLPNKGFGPWGALNPFEIWLMVILVAGLSFAGYAAIRLCAERRGVLLSGLAGGLVSSTAATLALARLAPDDGRRVPLYAAGILLASATMLVRVLIVAVLLEPALFPSLAPPLLASAGGAAAVAFRFWRAAATTEAPPITLGNPLDVGFALKFGALLAIVMLAVRAAQEAWGAEGAYAVAAAAGLADVDAITLSLARSAGTDVTMETAAYAILLAAFVNTIVKLSLATWAGGSGLARTLVAPMALELALLMAGAAASALLIA